jgi:hypothetical protein
MMKHTSRLSHHNKNVTFEKAMSCLTSITSGGISIRVSRKWSRSCCPGDYYVTTR